MKQHIPPAFINFAAQLKRRRKMLGLSQEALALVADVDRTFVSQIERGIGNPSLLIMTRLAAALEIDLYRLLQPEHISDTDDEFTL
ncbi:MAG: helix-turn-helix transcriptional regulator [Moraxellaceae bacterium]|nr:helix-turn-helix transcriptional regulator [Moraxellaceae bacterium]